MNDNKGILTLRWISRSVGLIFVVTLFLFFIGEKGWEDLHILSFIDIALLIIILFFIVGVFLGFYKEFWGGIIIIASILIFNIIDIIALGSFNWQLDLWFLLIPGGLYLIVYYLSSKNKKGKNKKE